jgi:cytochrome c peroxidase
MVRHGIALMAGTAVAIATAMAGLAAEQTGMIPELPDGVSRALYAIGVPPARIPTPDKVALGEKLFSQRRISADATVACSTSYDPDKGFTDHRAQSATSEGVGGKRGTRNAPTILNAMFHASEFWDGRSATLEDQAKLPILNPVEMAAKDGDEVVRKVRAIPEYADAGVALDYSRH